MRNFLKFNILLIALLLTVASCKSTKKVAQNEKLENALLWKVEGKDVKPSYVYGTIHIIDSKDYFLPTGTLTAFDQCPKIVYEIDMNEMNDMGKIMGIMNKLFMDDNKKLSDLISTDEYALVEAHFKKVGMPLSFFERMKPMFLTMFAYDFNPQDIQNGAMKSYEMEFHKLAENSGKSSGGLESIEFQIGVFDKIPYKEQAAMLVQTIQSGSDNSAMEEMTAMYKAQDITRMIKSISKDADGLGAYEDVLVGDRNRAWIPLMEKEMNQQSTFFAVGAGHLAGDDGVIKLLRKEGYTVTPISHTYK